MFLLTGAAVNKAKPILVVGALLASSVKAPESSAC